MLSFFVSVADMFVFVDKGHKAQHQFLSTTLYYFNIFKAENLQAWADTKVQIPAYNIEISCSGIMVSSCYEN